ncbi:MAG: response regulator [Rhodospirillales bacterium]
MTRVLLIEDDEDLRFALAGALASSGYDVSEAVEGAGALEAAADRRPDVVVTDIVMDGMEGISAIMALRARFGDIPIVAISGNSLYLRNSEKLGADAALLKPFRREVLLETIDKLLND